MVENYKDAIKNAKHHKALGTKEIYLGGDDIADKPWHLAESCESGGSHRLDIYTNVWFKGKDPKTGLQFRWSFDIEPYSANGTGSYQIDAPACRKVLALLPEKCHKAFRDYLSECAIAVRKKADEWEAIYLRQKSDALALTRIASAE